MKLSFSIDKNTDEYRALCEVAGEIGIGLGDNGIPVTLRKSTGKLRVFSDGCSVTVEYPTRIALMRSLGIIARYCPGSSFDISQSPSHDLGVMIDCSRNAVLNMASVKKMCRIIAAMGYKTMMLYTEDTYEIKEYPYFGHLRGRYTQEELREIDAYTALLGIELVPCIQTLAHLNALFQWPFFKDKFRDSHDVLLVGSDDVYKLIEAMLVTMKNCIKSRKINIGMDETLHLGRGKYLDQNGYRKRSDILLEHLAKVTELCKKHGYQPMMWSDMFFRMASKTGDYYDLNADITPDVIGKVPSEVTLVYWDYYGIDEAKYRTMFELHEKFRNPVAFAGGSSTWYGFVPLNKYAANTAKAALSSLKNRKIKDILVTMWANDGAECSHFCALPTLILYAEHCWGADMSHSALGAALYAITGANYDDFLDMELLADFPGRTDYGITFLNSCRYMLYQDILAGKLDRHIPAGTDEHFARCRDLLTEKRARNPKWAYLFDTLIALSDVLSVKAELGIKLRAAYEKGNLSELYRIKDTVLPGLIKRLETLYGCVRTQWKRDNKMPGLDIQDLRFGGLIHRTRHAIETIGSYLSGELGTIEELDAPRLKYSEDAAEGKAFYLQDRWNLMFTASVLHYNHNYD